MSVPAPPGRLHGSGWWLLALCLMGAAALAQSGITARLDHIVYDALLSRRPPPPSDRILIVALDERSLATVGPWPWPRRTQAALLDRLAAARPKAIGIDVLLSEPHDAEGDAALAKAIARAGNVFLPLAFILPGTNGRTVDLAPPLPAFARASAGIGHVNLSPDADGVMRTAWLGYATGGTDWPALPLAMLGRRAPVMPRSPGVTRASPVMIDYPGPAGTLPAVPAASVLRGEVPPELIAGRMVLVGMTASGLGDMHATPLAGNGPLMPGVEIQGGLLATLLSPRQLTPAPALLRLGFALLPVALLFLALALLPTRRGLPAALALVGVTLFTSSALLVWGDLWLPPAPAVLALFGTYALWSWQRLVVASHHVSHELERAAQEAGPLARVPQRLTGGVLDRQFALLADITARERELRHEHDAVIRLLSHDMRAPQGAIIALLDAAPDCPPALAERLRSHARRTLDLADGFVSLSRAQLVELAVEPVALADIAQDAADTVWPRAQARAMPLDLPDPEVEVLVLGDRSLLTRMLVNLLDNAVKYGAEGSPITVRLALESMTVRIGVGNQGEPIPPDQLGRIFHSFARAPGAGSQADGFGLGLAFVHTVAARHGGKVSCVSNAAGTWFSVTLPLALP